MSTCPQCNSPLKTVPAGVSKKTGKPYNAFTACSNRECTWKPASTGGYRSPAAPAAPQIGVANDMLHELQEIKAVLLAMNAKLAKNLHWQQLKKTDDAATVAQEATDELSPDEEIPF